MKKFIFALALAVILPLFSLAQGISVTGSAQVTATPDAASVMVAVITRDKDAGVAMKVNGKVTTTVVAALKKQGVDEKDVQTSNFMLEQDRSYDEKKKQDVFNGYVVTNSMSVTVKNLDKLSVVLNSSVENGVESVYGVHFFCTQHEDLLNKARKAAVVDAKRKAQLYADAVGGSLGSLVSLSEETPVVGVMRALNKEIPIEGAVLQKGQNTFSVKISTTWNLVNVAATKK
jgi:uncharacterized protein YggE